MPEHDAASFTCPRPGCEAPASKPDGEAQHSPPYRLWRYEAGHTGPRFVDHPA